MSTLLIHIRTTSDPTLVSLAGDLDMLSAPELRAHLVAVPDAHLVLDVSDLRFLDAAGLAVLLELQDRLDRVDARMVLAAAPRPVLQVIAITKLERTLPTARTVHDATLLLTGSSGRLPCLPAVGGARRA